MKKVAFSKCLEMGTIQPIEVFRHIQKEVDDCFILEREKDTGEPHYTLIGLRPLEKIQADQGEDILGKVKDYLEMGNEKLESTIEKLVGAGVGYLSYETVCLEEPLVLDYERLYPDAMVLFCKDYMVFDHQLGKITIATYGNNEDLVMLAAYLSKAQAGVAYENKSLSFEVRPMVSPETFKSNVNKVKKYIREGDIFQAVISCPFTFELEESIYPLYDALRTINPSPYMYFIKMGDLEIAGASPETLVKSQGEQVLTMPIAGTMKRGRDTREDQNLEMLLRDDGKENAEHRMLVDLGRNDIGKVSQFGSVEVSRYQIIQRFSHVMHLTSEVRGMLKENADGMDALRAILPAGTLSGAPKLRAMEIIGEMENRYRGVYGGGIGMIEQDGDVDFCIGIRTFVKYGTHGSLQAGAGIVLDSDPEKEYEEVFHKLKALLMAVEKVGGTYDFNC